MMAMKRLVMRWCVAAVLAVGAALSWPVESAQAQDFSIEIGPGGVQIGRSCPRTYDPVCAGPRSNPRTYRNACFAQREGARIRYDGECRRGGDDDDDFGGGGGGVRVCPEIYAPVCGQRPGRSPQTFTSRCVADAARARVLYRGECRRGGGAGFDDDNDAPFDRRACPRIYAPVCAGPRGRERTFANSCMAQQAGARIRYDGECRRSQAPGRPGATVGYPGPDGDFVIEDSPPGFYR